MEGSIATHNGTITIRNNATGGHRTFRIRTQADDAGFAPGKRIVAVRGAGDHDADSTWMGFGFVGDSGKISVWTRKRDGKHETYAKMLERPEVYEQRGCDYMFETRCRRCNRPLTNPESIETGIGPICAGR